MEYKDLKKGMYIRWYADRMFKGWDTYGKVLNKVNGNVSIITFDDFKTTTLSRGGEAIRDEIKVATKEDVLDYIEECLDGLKDRKRKLKREYKRDVRDIDKKLDKLKGLEL